jgi:hypothetical protein
VRLQLFYLRHAGLERAEAIGAKAASSPAFDRGDGAGHRVLLMGWPVAFFFTVVHRFFEIRIRLWQRNKNGPETNS